MEYRRWEHGRFDVELKRLGLPIKFCAWRDGQERAVEGIGNSKRRFVVRSMPTGAGKSLIYMAHALLSGLRTCVLTSTKGLQDQLMRDFGACGLVVIKGQNAYECKALTGGEFGAKNPDGTCDIGPCHEGFSCSLKESGCLYFDAYRAACKAQIVVTNYSYWMSINRYGQGLELDDNPFELMVMDESHAAPSEVSRFMGVRIFGWELHKGLKLGFPNSMNPSQSQWREWATMVYEKAIAKYRLMESMVKSGKYPMTSQKFSKEMRFIKKIGQRVHTLSEMVGKWSFERVSGGWYWEPVWPRKYTEAYLFTRIMKIIMVSATVQPKTAQILGVDKEHLDFLELPGAFRATDRPVIHVATTAIGQKSTSSQMQQWVMRIDQILRSRPNVKGIIHTVSFARRDFIISQSTESKRFITNNGPDTAKIVEKFKKSKSPLVMVSPSLATGWDFPDDQCRLQIVAKVPFPDKGSAAVQARSADDREYPLYVAMQALVQSCGRGVRSRDDWCETFIVDDNVGWFMRRHAHLAPRWFLDSFRSAGVIPPQAER